MFTMVFWIYTLFRIVDYIDDRHWRKVGLTPTTYVYRGKGFRFGRVTENTGYLSRPIFNRYLNRRHGNDPLPLVKVKEGYVFKQPERSYLLRSTDHKIVVWTDNK